MADNQIFENRVALRPEGNREVLCINCDEPFVFGMKDKFHEFSIGVTTILECLVVAEQEGHIPTFPDEWWILLVQRYPFIAKIREQFFAKCSVCDNPIQIEFMPTEKFHGISPNKEPQ